MTAKYRWNGAPQFVIRRKSHKQHLDREFYFLVISKTFFGDTLTRHLDKKSQRYNSRKKKEKSIFRCRAHFFFFDAKLSNILLRFKVNVKRGIWATPQRAKKIDHKFKT